MKRNLLWVPAMVLWAVTPAGATWVKHHETVHVAPGGAQVAEFTTISTLMTSANDALMSRRLYRDDRGRLLVLRRNYPNSAGGIAVDSVECLASGEVIRVEHVKNDKVTLRFGSQTVEVLASSVDPAATRLPQPALDQAAAVFQTISPPCRQALLRLAQIGASNSLELYTTSRAFVPFFFPEIEGKAPSMDTTYGPIDPVGPFDPSTNPPNAFEQLFGSAYFE